MVSFLIFILSVSFIIPVRTEAKTFESQFYLLSHNDNLYSYLIKERDEEINLVFDTKTNNVLVNNKLYSIEIYNNAVRDQVIDSSKETITFYLSNYPEVENINLVRAISSAPAPPRTGYGPEYKTISLKKINWAWAVTSAAITALATYMTGGNIEAAKKISNSVIQAAIAAGLVVTGDIYNSNIYTQYYQSHHLTVYGAVRERFRTYTKVETAIFWGNYSSYVYFWSINPY